MSTCPSMDLLIVEDEADFREMAARWMERHGHRVVQAANGQEALLACERKRFAVAIVDMNMPGISGLELLQRFRAEDVETEVIILTGQATVETAVEAMKLGAFDYLTKPFPLQELERRCLMAFERGQLQQENRNLRVILKRERKPQRMIGESARMQEIQRLIERVGPTDKAVLIEGESGTGKELVARALHAASSRADRPLVTINCGALPEHLVESELFGHEKGAFTGAAAAKSGLFEVADGGTLFIDEIGELPLGLQPKLLRVLEDGSLRRVGSHQERRVDVRIIAATNRKLDTEVKEGRFREDLFYRINVFGFVLPPLRERPGDIALLVGHLLGPTWEIDPTALAALEGFRWPGNVRQLINVIERAKILANGRRVTLDELPSEITGRAPQPLALAAARSTPAEAAAIASAAGPGAIVYESTSLAAVERQHILDVLRREHGNKARAARVLGIHRRKLYRLLERLQISPAELTSPSSL